ncbi:MAG TPA: Co2+/Mg2+ efflux protein ApaG [Sphingomonas sp.]|nr:Co2+/Mg2+ efflux protein ApaG [Sphingomonas sp.]
MNALFPYAETTHDVTVRVSVSFLPEQSMPDKGQWFWAYHVRVENGSDMAVQLMSRRWIIADGRGQRHVIEGEGVIGEQPVIAPGENYDYVSGCPLGTPTGSMQGAYIMIAEDGSSFEVAIPKFALTAPVAAQ